MTPFRPFSLNISGTLHRYDTPVVMGIINVTPDSFHASSRAQTRSAVAARVEQMIADGADWIDLGGYSSRPGAADVSEAEELERVAMGIEAIRSVDTSIPISIDTFRSTVAQTAVTELGANIINDISGCTLDSMMAATMARLRVPVIVMHMRGTPATMSAMTDYAGGVAAQVATDLAAIVAKLSSAGVADIIIDPGFGFAKTVDQNYTLLRQLNLLQALGRPILVGLSRKSMLYGPLSISPDDALSATVAANTIALMGGASVVRVHDVKTAREAIKIVNLTYPS